MSNKEEVGCEFAVDIGAESFPGKVESAVDGDSFNSVSVGKVSLQKGEKYDITAKITKQVGSAMHLRCLALVRKKD